MDHFLTSVYGLTSPFGFLTMSEVVKVVQVDQSMIYDLPSLFHRSDMPG